MSKSTDEMYDMVKIDSNPVSLFTENVDCMAFPCRFPLGSGGRVTVGLDRRSPEPRSHTFDEAHVYTADDFARRDINYLYFLAGNKENRRLSEGMFGVHNTESAQLTKKDIAEGADKHDKNLMRKLSCVMKELPSSREYWNDVLGKVQVMVAEYGPATWWLTISPGEYDDPDLHAYLLKMNPSIPDAGTLTTSQLIVQDPVLACDYIQNKADAIIAHILGDMQPIGKVTHHFVRTEYQTRLMPHFHCMFWIEDAPIIGVDPDEEVLKFIGKYASCKLPNKDDKMYQFVHRYNRHKCNGYCLKSPKLGGKPVCKFGFPRRANVNPVLHPVAASIASYSSRQYKTRLYELKREVTETRINDYNPEIMYLWQGNSDIQFIGEKSEQLIHYICKYANKAPKSAITDIQACQVSGKSVCSSLYGLARKRLQQREMGPMEARNFICNQNPFLTDAQFQFVNARYPKYRKRMLKSKTDLKKLDDQSTDLYHGSLIDSWYLNRPKNLEGMSLQEFCKTYKRITASNMRLKKDKSRLLELQNNAGYMEKRKEGDTTIIYGPSNFNLRDPKQADEFYYSHIMMHKPWRSESELIKLPDGSSADSYHAVYDIFKDFIPSLKLSVETVFYKKDLKDQMEKEIESAMPKDTKNKPSNVNTGGAESDTEHPSDFFEVIRRQTLVETKEQLEVAVNMLSPDQLRVYKRFVENVEHYYRHKHHGKYGNPECSCRLYKPLKLFVSGFGGSGKSHLIRVLMGYQYVRSEVEKKATHILLGAPTGIASCNIGGQTLHSIWELPVHERNSYEGSYKNDYTLNNNALHRMKVNYQDVCGHIIDEVSMISNRMLMDISLRMNEVTGVQDESFGGIPMIMFGDLFQLAPVSDKPPFVEMTGKQVHSLFGGIAIPSNLWQEFEFDELTTNHRQKGDNPEQTKWRGFLSRVRLGMMNNDDVTYLWDRMIKKDQTMSDEDYRNACIDKFLECDAKGENPVCLLPKRDMCTDFNKAVMAKKGETLVPVKAIDRIVNSTNVSIKTILEKISSLDERQCGGLDTELNIAINTRVMLRVNDKTRPGLVNGARGTVTEIETETVVDPNSGKLVKRVKKIMVKFDDIEEVQCIERIDRMFHVNKGCRVYRSMFPLCNSYAMTIHKSQSLSLSCVFADLGNNLFADGMAYVALSRCTSYKGLYLLNMSPCKFKASPAACQEYMRLKNLGNDEFKFNGGSKKKGSDRLWCKSLAEKLLKRSLDDAFKNLKSKTKRQKTTKKSAVTHPKDSSAISAQPTKIRNKRKVADPKSGKARKRSAPVSAAAPTNNSDVVITHEVGAPNQQFDYMPVKAPWQKEICKQLCLRYIKASRSPGVGIVRGISLRSRTPRPKAATSIVGDGHCWYRSLCYIITGSEDQVWQFKDELQEFIVLNKSLVQRIIDENMSNGNSDIFVAQNMFCEKVQQYAQNKQRLLDLDCFIDYHFTEATNTRHTANAFNWADQMIIDLCRCFLMVNIFIYNEQPGAWTSCFSTYFWDRRSEFQHTIDFSRINEEGSLYIAHVDNGQHFEVIHNGLMR